MKHSDTSLVLLHLHGQRLASLQQRVAAQRHNDNGTGAGWAGALLRLQPRGKNKARRLQGALPLSTAAEVVINSGS